MFVASISMERVVMPKGEAETDWTEIGNHTHVNFSVIWQGAKGLV